MKDSIRDRIKVTGSGKLLRRPMGIGHSKAKKSGTVKQKKRKRRNIHDTDIKTFQKLH